ncbi:hypothetical protein [Streptosporangium sp. OZ121]|uniref:hypothetical protein n=1 Tax=Streptosporangium sp. OZ121 TaxID=3444183 RepID=UPI003F7AC6E1
MVRSCRRGRCARDRPPRDPAGLERLLADDAVTWSDGGGRVNAALRPVAGRSGYGTRARR